MKQISRRDSPEQWLNEAIQALPAEPREKLERCIAAWAFLRANLVDFVAHIGPLVPGADGQPLVVGCLADAVASVTDYADLDHTQPVERINFYRGLFKQVPTVMRHKIWVPRRREDRDRPLSDLLVNSTNVITWRPLVEPLTAWLKRNQRRLPAHVTEDEEWTHIAPDSVRMMVMSRVLPIYEISRIGGGHIEPLVRQEGIH